MAGRGAKAVARLDADRRPTGPAAIGLGRILFAFFRLGCTAFGGGTAGWLYREMVLTRRWIDDREYLALLAVGQVMPGANGVKMTVLIGQRLHGAAGAAVALFGLLAGPLAIVVAIGALYGGFGGEAIVHRMLDGAAAAVIGLTFATGLRSLAKGAPKPPALAFAAATVLAVGVLRWPMLPVIAVLAPASIALAFAEARHG